jgi:pyruvate dehydrogenase E2 component (dihydrolipoamide acetyltransferase)
MQEFKVPELGENVSQGDVTRVLVKVGDTIDKEQPVVELETDKATQEVPAPASGRLRIRVQAAGRSAGRVAAFVCEAESASAVVCSQCGAPGLRAERGGWTATLCGDHQAQGLWL